MQIQGVHEAKEQKNQGVKERKPKLNVDKKRIRRQQWSNKNPSRLLKNQVLLSFEISFNRTKFWLRLFYKN